MKIGALVSIIVAALAMSGMVFTFLNNASPYVTVAEARMMKGDNLHLAGDIDRTTLVTDVKGGTMRFVLIDQNGDRVRVSYSGIPPSNMGEAEKVVAIGKMGEENFESRKLLVKCPSTYQGEKKS
jgi:cytochrome c-type biogenesis protein CcmE